MTTVERVEKCRFMIKGIVNTFFVIDQNLKLLLPLLNDKDIYSIWDYAEGVDGVAAMRMALYSHILSDARAIMFDTGKNVASIHNIVSALDDNGVVSTVKADFCKPTGVHVCGDHSPEREKLVVEAIQKEDTERKTSLFSETLNSLRHNYKRIKESELGCRVDTARSKMISHKQVTTIEGQRKLFDAKDFGLKFSDAKEFVQETQEIIFAANLLLLNSSYDLGSFLGYHEKVAEVFWGKCKNT